MLVCTTCGRWAPNLPEHYPAMAAHVRGCLGSPPIAPAEGATPGRPTTGPADGGRAPTEGER